MADSSIEWTEKTWNPVTGCDRVSPGCAHCYALTLAGRLKAMGQAKYQKDGDPKTSGPGFGVTLHPAILGEPLRWRTPRVVFVNSMSDLFHDEIPGEYICAVFGIMEVAKQHTFQVLTKRPERMATWAAKYQPRPLQNVWLGTSIENRRFVDRADLLRATPAAVRFISAEPLLGPLLPDADYMVDADGDRYDVGDADFRAWRPWADEYQGPGLDLEEIDWLIVGGESGKGHRRFDWDWARDLRDACQASGTAYFLKQGGGHRPGDKLEDLPEDLRIREYPTPVAIAA